jgi:hypothetical protein
MAPVVATGTGNTQVAGGGSPPPCRDARADTVSTDCVVKLDETITVVGSRRRPAAARSGRAPGHKRAEPRIGDRRAGIGSAAVLIVA